MTRHTELLDRVQRLLLMAVVAGGVVVFWRDPLDSFSLVKGTWIALGAIAVGLVAVWRVARTGRVRLPRTAFTAAAAVLALGLAVAALVGGDAAAGLLGEYKRWTGLVPYLAYLALAVAAVGVHRTADHATALLRVLAVVGGLVAATALVQRAGVEPFDLVGPANQDRPFATLGNTNFSSAVVGMLLPASAWLALEPEQDRTWRLAGGVGVALSVAALAVMGPLQGPLVALIAGAVVVIAVVRERSDLVRAATATGPRVLGLGLVPVVGIVTTTIVLGQRFVESLGFGFQVRVEVWEAALRMVGERPFLGWGLSSFGDHSARFLDADYVRLEGDAVANTVHSVPLSMLTDGGVVLAVAYVAFVAVTGWTLVRGVASSDGLERRALVALGAVWLGYHLQSLVSMDEPPLAVVHYVTAGAIVGLAARPDWWTAPVPGLRPRASRGGRRGRRSSPTAVGVQGPAVVLALVAVWFVLLPLRADLAAGRGSELAEIVRQGTEDAAPASLAALDRAITLAPWEGEYRFQQALLHQYTGDLAAVRDDLEVAAELEPGRVTYARDLAAFERALGDAAAAATWYERAIARFPAHAPTRVAAAEFFADTGNEQLAERLVERALELDPDNEAALELVETFDGAS